MKSICIKLNDKDYADFQRAKQGTKKGATAMLRTMVKNILKVLPPEQATEEEIG